MPLDALVGRYLLIPLAGLLAGWVVMRWMARQETPPARIGGVRADRVLLALMAVGAVTMGGMVAARYLTWHSFVFDLGSYDQKAWFVAGEPTTWGMLQQTYEGGVHLSPCGLERYWGICHFQPTFLIPGLLYRAWGSPLVLLGLQVLLVASGVIPAFLLARDHFGPPTAGTVAAAIYLLHPAVQFNGLLDFRPDHLAIPTLLWAYFLARRGWHVAALGVAGLSGLAKDTLILNVAFFGLYLALRHRRRALGGAAFVVGVGMFYLVRFHLLNFNGVSEGQFMLDRYFPVLSGLMAGEMPGIVGNPLGSLLNYITRPGNLLYVGALFIPLAFLPLLALPELLPAIPSIAISLLSVNVEHASIESQYSASVVGPAFAALLVAVARLGTRFGRWAAPVPTLTGLVVLSAFVSFGLGPTPLSLNFWNRAWGGRWHVTQYLPDRQHVLNRAARLVPVDPEAALVTQNDVNSKRLAHRHEYFAFPNALERADYVLLDTRRQPYVYWTPDPARYQVLLRGLLADPAYRLIFDEEGVLLFERRLSARRPWSDSRTGANTSETRKEK